MIGCCSVAAVALPFVFSAFVVCATLSALYFVLGVHPYRFVIFIMYCLIFPTFNVILLILATTRSSATAAAVSAEASPGAATMSDGGKVVTAHHLNSTSRSDTLDQQLVLAPRAT
jgi:hypothetical protein